MQVIVAREFPIIDQIFYKFKRGEKRTKEGIQQFRQTGTKSSQNLIIHQIKGELKFLPYYAKEA